MNSSPYKYFLNFPMFHLTAAPYPTKLCIDFSSGDTVDLDMKKLAVGTLIPETCKIHTFHRLFLVPMTFLPPLSNMLANAPLPFHPWTSFS